MTDSERLKAVNQLIKHDPFAPTYEISNANMKFLMRRHHENSKLKSENDQLKKDLHEVNFINSNLKRYNIQLRERASI